MAEALTKPEGSLYSRDFYAWTQDQAAKLRARRAFDRRGDIDWENAAEEIESLGRSERSEIRNRLSVLLIHLLKWQFQPSGRSSSWKGTIAEQRDELNGMSEDSPSLRSYPETVLERQYRTARLKAAGETGLPEETFPPQCPFRIEDVLDPGFYPEAP